MTNKPKFFLVRSPRTLIERDQIGYGWKKIDFSNCKDEKALFSLFEKQNVDYGRKKKQIKRYFNLAKGNFVIVPVSRGITIAEVIGVKTFEEGVPYGENRISVKFFRDDKGNAIVIPRAKLKQGLESRLKIRMTVSSLDDFDDELNSYVEALENEGSVCFDGIYQQQVKDAEDLCKDRLLDNIRGGKTRLKAGGYGLEELVKELLRLEGYTAKIEAKNQSSDGTDIDISASRDDQFSSHRLFVQVKHHSGTTSQKAVKQLIDIEDKISDMLGIEPGINYSKYVITTANVTDETKEYAEDNSILIMNGEDFINWLFENLHKLSPEWQAQLGVAVLPQVV